MEVDQSRLSEVLLHCRWFGSEPLSPEAAEKVGPYLTRYGQTLKVAVSAVGASKTGSTLHLLLSLPGNLSSDDLMRHLQVPSARFVSTILKVKTFAWTATQVESVSVGNKEDVRAEIQSGSAADLVAENEADGDDEVPAWLRDALKQP